MNSLIYLLLVLPCASQFPEIELGGGSFQQINYGEQFPVSQGVFVCERLYHVRGRLVCEMQGAQGDRESIWEKRGDGSTVIYMETMNDVSGSSYLKAEIRSGGGWNGGGSHGYHNTLNINHNFEGQRQISASYLNKGFAAMKTFSFLVLYLLICIG